MLWVIKHHVCITAPINKHVIVMCRAAVEELLQEAKKAEASRCVP